MGGAWLKQHGIARIGSPKSGFRYRMPAGSGRKLTAADRERINALRIPPAWREVRIATKAGAKLQAIGFDAADRLQYLYHAGYRERQESAKYAKLVEFGKRLPAARRTMNAHLRQSDLTREKVLAAMLRLVNIAHFRVGGEQYAKSQNSYGIATLRRKHVHFKRNTIVFEYLGKSGQTHSRSITDRMLCAVVKECAAAPGLEVFTYYDESGNARDVKSADVNRYVKKLLGPSFSVKDFRTWSGSLIAACTLSQLGPADSQRAANQNIVAAIDTVANSLGNTRAIARSSYVAPRIVEHYLAGRTMPSRAGLNPLATSRRTTHSPEERALLRMLAEKPLRKLRYKKPHRVTKVTSFRKTTTTRTNAKASTTASRSLSRRKAHPRRAA